MALAEKFKIVLTAIPLSTARFKTYLLSCKPSGNQDWTCAAKETLTTAIFPDGERIELALIDLREIGIAVAAAHGCGPYSLQ